MYLVGSSAAESQSPGRDIDLALLTSEPLSPLDCWSLSQAQALLAGRDVDLVDLGTVSTGWVSPKGVTQHCDWIETIGACEGRKLGRHVHHPQWQSGGDAVEITEAFTGLKGIFQA